MALPKFLLQVRDGRESSVYRWTAALAKRKDMRPITGKEAKKFLDVQEEKRQERLRVLQEDMFADGDDDFEENEITSDPDLAIEEKKPAEHPSFKTQETIQADEIARIEGFKTKNELEVYFLEKYQLDMMPGTREEMNAQAVAFVNELAKHGRLYAKLNE